MRLPRTLIATLEYPPRPYGASLLLYRQLSDLANLPERESIKGQPWCRVITPMPRRPDLTPLDPPPDVEVQHFPDFTKPVVRVPYYAANAWRLARDFEAEVIYANQYRAFGPVVQRMAKKRGIEYVAYFHGTEIKTELARPMRHKLVKEYAQGAYQCITNSESSIELIEKELGPLKRPPIRLSPTIDPAPYVKAKPHRARIRSSMGIEGAIKDVLLVAARLDQNKNLIALLWALDQMREFDATADPTSNIDVWIAGDGPERRPLAEKARELGMIVEEPGKDAIIDFLIDYDRDDPIIRPTSSGPRIIFLDTPPPPLMPLLFVSADFVVSTSHYESFGMTLLEAAAAKRPVLAPKVGGIPTIVEDGVTGILMPTNSSEDIAAGIEQLIHMEKPKRKQMGRAARKRCETEFAPGPAAERLAEVLIEAAKAGGS